MTGDYIPYGRQWVDETDIEAVSAVLRSGWLTTGPLVERFEEALAGRVGARYCVVLNSGTAALHAAYDAAGVGAGDEVVTTPLSFAATANAALYLGAKPIFVDIGADSLHIDAEKIEAAITPKTKAIAPVDMAGMPADMAEINKLAKDYGLKVIEDASHALGASYRGRPVGSLTDMSTFSFHPVKQITTGEGGAVTTDDEELCRCLRSFRSHGFVRDAKLFTAAAAAGENSGPWYAEQQGLGFNYRLPDINCALGLSQLGRLDSFLKRRRALAALYNEAFRGNPDLIVPPEQPAGADLEEGAWHLYILRLTGENPPRRRLLEQLNRQGIGTQVHYMPIYLHPYYRQIGYSQGLCPNAEDYYRRAFSIPLFPAMSDADVERVIAGIFSALKGL